MVRGNEKVAREVADKQPVKEGNGVQLPTISSQDDETSWTYNHVHVALDEKSAALPSQSKLQQSS